MIGSKPLRWCIFFVVLIAVTLAIWIIAHVLSWSDYNRGVAVGTVSALTSTILMAELRL